MTTPTGILWDAAEELKAGTYYAQTLDDDVVHFLWRTARRHHSLNEGRWIVELREGIMHGRRAITHDNVEEEFGIICRWVYQGLLP